MPDTNDMSHGVGWPCLSGSFSLVQVHRARRAHAQLLLPAVLLSSHNGKPRASAVCSATPVAMAWSWHATRLWTQQRAEAVAMAAHTTPTGHSTQIAWGWARAHCRHRGAPAQGRQHRGAPVATIMGTTPVDIALRGPSWRRVHGIPPWWSAPQATAVRASGQPCSCDLADCCFVSKHISVAEVCSCRLAACSGSRWR